MNPCLTYNKMYDFKNNFKTYSNVWKIEAKGMITYNFQQ
jgi:hypothetical protein